MGKGHKNKQSISVLLAAKHQTSPQSVSSLTRLPREILRVVVEHLHRGEQMRTLACLAATCRRMDVVVKPFLNARLYWDEGSWAAEKNALAGSLPDQWKHVRYVFLTGGALNCDWWWHDLARLAPECKTRDAIIHHFFPSIHYIAETHDAKYFKFPYTFWLSTRTVPRFDAAYMKGLVAAVGKMHRAQGGKIKGIAEDRMPAFHSNFEPNVPSERTEHMLAQVNKITTFISKKSSKATPVPWEMNTPSLIRTDAIISLEQGIKMDILLLDDPAGKTSRLRRLQRIVELFFALKAICVEKMICKPIELSVVNHDFANFEGWIQAITSSSANSSPFSYFRLNLAIADRICPERFERELFPFYCETVFPHWHKGRTRHLLPSSIIIEANTMPGGSDGDLREAHVKLNLKDPWSGTFISIVQWSSPKAPLPGQMDSMYLRTIHCFTKEVVADGHTEIKTTTKKPQRRLIFKGMK